MALSTCTCILESIWDQKSTFKLFSTSMYHYTDIVVDGGSRVGAQIESWAAAGHAWPRDVTTLAPPSTIMSVYAHMLSVRRVLPGFQQFRSQVFPLTHARINRCTGMCTFPNYIPCIYTICVRICHVLTALLGRYRSMTGGLTYWKWEISAFVGNPEMSYFWQGF